MAYIFWIQYAQPMIWNNLTTATGLEPPTPDYQGQHSSHALLQFFFSPPIQMGSCMIVGTVRSKRNPSMHGKWPNAFSSLSSSIFRGGHILHYWGCYMAHCCIAKFSYLVCIIVFFTSTSSPLTKALSIQCWMYKAFTFCKQTKMPFLTFRIFNMSKKNIDPFNVFCLLAYVQQLKMFLQSWDWPTHHHILAYSNSAKSEDLLNNDNK